MRQRWILALAWLAIVAVGMATHVFWRDEVRAMTLAFSAPNVLLVPAWIHGDGHPALWFLLLRVAHDLVHTNAVLPAVGFAVAAVGVALFISSAPFATWWKALFVFSGWSIYEYSVIDRNYGISMTIMFAIAFFASRRPRNVTIVALLLFALGQTNIHSAIIAPFFLLALVRRTDGSRVWKPQAAYVVAVVLGLVVAVATVYPPRHDLAGLDRQISFSGALPAFDPGTALSFFPDDGWSSRSIIVSLIVYAACLALLPSLELVCAALGSLWCLVLLNEFVYPMHYRHVGLWVCFVLSLYWIRLAPELHARVIGEARGYYRVVRYIAVVCGTLLLAANDVGGVRAIFVHLGQPTSDSRALATNIANDPSLHDATIMAEPEELAEAMPYYVSNPIYLLREQKFGSAATWSRAMRDYVTLGDVLSTATALRAQNRQPVILILSDPLTPTGAMAMSEFRLHFSYTPEQVREFTRATTRLPGMERGSSETFNAFVLR